MLGPERSFGPKAHFPRRPISFARQVLLHSEQGMLLGCPQQLAGCSLKTPSQQPATPAAAEDSSRLPSHTELSSSAQLTIVQSFRLEKISIVIKPNHPTPSLQHLSPGLLLDTFISALNIYIQ